MKNTVYISKKLETNRRKDVYKYRNKNITKNKQEIHRGYIKIFLKYSEKIQYYNFNNFFLN